MKCVESSLQAVRAGFVVVVSAGLMTACGTDTLHRVENVDGSTGGCTDCGAPSLEPGVGRVQGRLCNSAVGVWQAGTVARLISGNQEFAAVTDVEGRFEVEAIPPGEYTLSYADQTIQLLIEAGQTTLYGADTCIAPPGNIAGRACDPQVGTWLAGATISLDDPARTTVQADNFGNYSFSGVPAGRYVLSITTTDGYFATREAVVTAEQTTDMGPGLCQGGSGQIAGRICGGSGYWLSGARVRVDTGNGGILETVTDGDGRYTLAGLPPGNYTAEVTKGSFSNSFDVSVGNGLTEIDQPVCVSPSSARIAIVTGLYDDVEHVLASLGFQVNTRYSESSTQVENPEGSVDVIAGRQSSFWLESFLSDPLWMSDYDIVFFNCGLEDGLLRAASPMVGDAVGNLQAFVAGGGSIYVSDWANEILRLAFPGRINFMGHETEFGHARQGKPTPAQVTEVVDPSLYLAVGRPELTINLDIPQWSVMDSRHNQPSDLRVLLEGDVPYGEDFESHTLEDAPMLVRFAFDQGRVIFTSAHHDSQVTDDLAEMLNYVVFEL